MFLGFKKDSFWDRSFPSRPIGNAGAVSDRDADKFIFTANITNETERQAIYTLVHLLKIAGIWSKMRAIYPFVGGTALSCSYNLVNQSAFQISWINGPTFSANGVQGNGTSQYGNTGFIPSAQLAANNCSISYYTRTTGTGAVGSITAGPAYFYITPQAAGGVGISFGFANFTGATNNTGLFMGTKTAANAIRVFKDGAFTSQTSSATALGASVFLLLAYSTNNTPAIGGYNTQQCSFCHIGEALSDTEASDLYSIVQRFQTILGRQV